MAHTMACQEHSNSVLNSMTLTHLCVLGQPLPFSSVTFPLCSAGVDAGCCSQPCRAFSTELSVWAVGKWALEISPIFQGRRGLNTLTHSARRSAGLRKRLFSVTPWVVGILGVSNSHSVWDTALHLKHIVFCL